MAVAGGAPRRTGVQMGSQVAGAQNSVVELEGQLVGLGSARGAGGHQRACTAVFLSHHPGVHVPWS